MYVENSNLSLANESLNPASGNFFQVLYIRRAQGMGVLQKKKKYSIEVVFFLKSKCSCRLNSLAGHFQMTLFVF